MLMLLRVRFIILRNLLRPATQEGYREGNGTPECARLAHPAEKTLQISHDHRWSSNRISSERTDFVSWGEVAAARGVGFLAFRVG